MRGSDGRVERLLLEAEWLEPHGDVRRRVLGAAMPLVRPDRSRLDRIWFSPTYRLAAVLALIVLIGVDVVSGRLVSMASGAQERRASDVAQAVAMAALDAGLTPAEAAALAEQALDARRPQRPAVDLDALLTGQGSRE